MASSHRPSRIELAVSNALFLKLDANSCEMVSHLDMA